MRYYTPKEVSMHNCAEDCWVSIFHKVYDLSNLIQMNRGPLVQPIIQHAGEDISHWFDEKTCDVKTHLDPERHIRVPFLPHGRFLDVPPPDPVSNWSTRSDKSWWQDEETYCVGNLTYKTRSIEVVNVLTQQTKVLEVCTEETIEEIQDRYLEWNSHAKSYTWKHLQDDEFVPLNMKANLSDNGISDDHQEFEQLEIDPDDHRPILHVYFNDDLTVL